MKKEKSKTKNITKKITTCFNSVGKNVFTTIKYVTAVLVLVGLFSTAHSQLKTEFVLASTYQLLAADFSTEKMKNAYTTGDMELARIEHRIERLEDKYGENPKDATIKSLMNLLKRDRQKKESELQMLKQQLIK